MIGFDGVTVTYPDAPRPALRDVDLAVEESTFCLVTGVTGSGKSTLLGAINGLVPHFTGGTVTGRIVVGGRNTAHHPPSSMADLVGFVGQDPQRGFVAEVVEDELAYGMEQHGVDPAIMRARVEETLDLLGVAHLRQRRLAELSGGEQQRVAIGSVLTMQPSVLVLDEPTSALDPAAAEEVLALLNRLVHDVGLTVVLAEHRLERVVQYAEQMVSISAGGTVQSGDPRSVVSGSPLAPPVVHLGRIAGWQPVPLTVREARRRAPELHTRLRPSPPAHHPHPRHLGEARALTVTFGATVALDDVDLQVRAGEVSVIMGRNGSGKTTLFWALHRTIRPSAGTVAIEGRVGLVPQNPSDLLYLPTVHAECRQADRDAGRETGTCRSLLSELVPGVADDTHPADLSEGQRLALALAIQLVSDPDLLLLDEPTRGLDYTAKSALAGVIHRLTTAGSAVMLSTHDVEFAALVADRVVVLAEGRVVTEGPALDVLTATPLFSPQVAKVMAPLRFLTPEQVREAMVEEVG